MSKLIGQLLGSDERELSSLIKRLESVCIQPGVDTRLTAEIITLSREKSRQLGLDTRISTKKELYYALLAKAETDGETLRSKLGITAKTMPVEAAELIAKSTEKLLKKELVVCMQSPAVRKVLKAVPPKKTMRSLHFRSIESVLKRENPLVVYALAMRLEDKSWHTQVRARLKRLQPREAKEAPVQVLSLPEIWLEKLKTANFDTIIQPVPEIGSLLILPSMPLEIKGSVLLTASLVLQAAQRMAVDSLPYRTQALTTSYEDLLPSIAAGETYELESIHGLTPSWQAVFQLLAGNQKRRQIDFDFMLSDLEWQSTETRLAGLASELDFWVNTHYLGFPTEALPVSMHVVDVAANLVMGRGYQDHITTHLRASLWNELQLRYLKQENLERQIVAQVASNQQELVL